MLGQGLALRALDLLELVDLGAFAVVRAANAVGKQLLKVRIAHDEIPDRTRNASLFRQGATDTPAANAASRVRKYLCSSKNITAVVFAVEFA
jgi:hypothetical protein